MSLHGLDARFREAGRLRAGRQVEGKGGKPRPTSLEHWRVTTPSKALAQQVADEYGGEVTRWEPASGGAGAWEVLTTTDTLDVVMPPYGQSLTQSYERWTGGGLDRRCDGRVQVTGERCVCPADLSARDRRNHCLPTSRLSVMLPAVNTLGVWTLSTKGINAAVELGAVEGLINMASGRGVWLSGVLRLEQRSSTSDGVRQDYVVPVLDFPGLSVAGLAGSAALELAAAEPPDDELLGSGSEAPQLGAPNEEAAPAPEPARAADVTPDEAPVTQAHLAAIHARARELGITDAARKRAMAAAFDGVSTSRDLTAGQARTLLRILDDPDHEWTQRMLELSAEGTTDA